MEPERCDDDYTTCSFFSSMREVIRRLGILEGRCGDKIESIHTSRGPGTGQLNVSEYDIYNTTMENVSSTMGADQFVEKKMDKFVPLMQGQNMIIDLTSEDSCDSLNLEIPYQEPAGQILWSSLGTNMANGITSLCDEDDDDDDESGDYPKKAKVEKKDFQNPWASLGTNMANDITILSDEDDDGEVGYLKNALVEKGDGSDPLFNVWGVMRRAMESIRQEEPVKGVKEEHWGRISVKRRKANNGNVVPQDVSVKFQGPAAEEAQELLNLKSNYESCPTIDSGKPLKEDHSQVKCKDFLENLIEKPTNNDGTMTQGSVDGYIHLQPGKIEKTRKGDNEVRRDTARKEEQARQEEKVGKRAKGDEAVKGDKARTEEQARQEEKVGKGEKGDEAVKGDKARKEVQARQEVKIGEREKEGEAATRDGCKEIQSNRKGRKRKKILEEFLEDEFDEEEEDMGKTRAIDLPGELLKLSSKLKGEKIDYEPYVHQRYEEEEEEDLDDIFDNMKVMAITSGCSADTMTNKKECEHKNFDFDDNTGYYCPDCGTIGLEMPTSQRNCHHKNRESSDDAGIFCLDCGKVLIEIQNYFVAGDMLKALRKQTTKVQEYEHGSTQVQLNLQGSNVTADLCGVDLQLHPSSEEKMRPHQKRGFNFLAKHVLGGQQPSEQMGCILAHAPGTGKTGLVICFIQSFLAKFPEGKPLVLAPKIVLQSWEHEFETWKVQDVPIYRLDTNRSGGPSSCYGDGGYEDDDGDEDDSRLPPAVKATRKEARALILKEWQEGRGVLLLSYDLFSNVVSLGLGDAPLESLDYQMSRVLIKTTNLVILDEGHLARNRPTKVSKALLAMDTKRKVILSGTLFQNSFKELYNLLKLCRDDFMISHPQYQRKIAEGAAFSSGLKHGNDVACLQKRSLKDIMLIEEKLFIDDIGEKLEKYVKSGEDEIDEIKPVALKLQSLTQFVDWYKGDILKTLPGLYEYSVHLNLTRFQQQTIASISPNANYMSRQCDLSNACIHPSLLHQAEDALRELRGSASPTESALLELSGSASPTESEAYKGVKIWFLRKLLTHCKMQKEKLLIFCSTLCPLATIEKFFCKLWNWQSGKQVLCLNGDMQESDRQRVIVQFNDMKSTSQVLLASTKACKEGISLVGASRVVILDCIDNPAVTRQAVSRAFRIGQTKKVYVYRLVAEQKDEQLIFHRSVYKERLSQVLLDPVSTMARMLGFLQDVRDPADIEDEILQKIVLDDKANGGQIKEIKIYNALD